MKTSQIAKQSVHDVAYWRLRAAIQDGAFEPGQKLTNRQLAAAVGFSVTPVREAIRRLISEGALRALPNGSTAVPIVQTRDVIDEIGWIVSTLEARAVSLAMPRMTPGDVARLEALLEGGSAACEQGDFIRANSKFREFYFSLFERAEQPVLLSMLDMLWLRLGSLHRTAFPHFAKTEGGRCFRELIEAARRKDPTSAVVALTGFHHRLEKFLLERQGGSRPERGEAGSEVHPE